MSDKLGLAGYRFFLKNNSASKNAVLDFISQVVEKKNVSSLKYETNEEFYKNNEDLLNFLTVIKKLRHKRYTRKIFQFLLREKHSERFEVSKKDMYAPSLKGKDFTVNDEIDSGFLFFKDGKMMDCTKSGRMKILKEFVLRRIMEKNQTQFNGEKE